MLVLGSQQPRRHHRRQGQRHDAGDEHRARKRERELAEQRAGEPALDADRDVDRGESDGHCDDWPDQLARAEQRRVIRRASLADVALDVLDHDDRVVDDQTDRQHDRQQGQQIQREAEDLHQEHAADQRHRDRDHRHQGGAERAQEQEDHHHHDQDGFAERMDHLAHGVADVGGRVVGDHDLHARRQLGADVLDLLVDVADDVDRAGAGQHPHAHEHRLLAGETYVLVVVVGAQLHVGDVLQSDQRAVLLADDQPLEIVERAHVGGRRDVHLHQRAFGRARGGQVVVGGQRAPELRRRDVERRHAIRLEPGAQGERARAQDLGALHAGDRRQPRLHDPDQVVGDLVALEHVGGEAEIHPGDLRVGRLDLDRGHLRFRRQIGADLVHARADVGQRLGGVEVQLQPYVDGRQAEDALRLDVVDTVGGGDRALERSRDEAAHQVGVGADVDGPHAHGGALQLRILAHVQRADRLQPGDDDQHADDDRQHRPSQENVGELHGVSGSAVPAPAGASPARCCR